MENSGQLHPQPQPLQCPRCSSSNTKFCYYNNYSLAQPRHFCKACKRYWTRGGTLRNIPVGGGCRKNKRIKRQAAMTTTTSFNFAGGGDGISSPFSVIDSNNIVRSCDLDLSQSSDPGRNNPSFYPNPREIKFPFSTFSSIRVSSELGFSSGIGAGDESQQINHENVLNQIQDAAITNSNSGLVPSSAAGNVNPAPPLGSSTSTMASLLAYSFQQQNFLASDLKHVQQGHNFRNSVAYEDVEVQSVGNQKIMGSTIEQMNTSPCVLWNTTGDWFDPSDLGSSVPSLI